MNKAVFLDKDGTLVQDVPYNVDPAKVIFEDGVLQCLHRLRQRGFRLIMVTNQSGIARGYFEPDQLMAMFNHIQNSLNLAGVRLDGIYFCPHHPCGKVDNYAVECQCRKPQPGMLLQAANDFDIDLTSSWMIGDILNDVEAGSRAGCRTIHLDNGHETEWLTGIFRVPDYTTDNIIDATDFLLSEDLKKVLC